MKVVDCDTESPSYGQVVGWAELPTAGNEFHHFGWNACSSALCHEGHAHHGLERRYLLVPGLRSSRTYVLDTKPDPRHAHRADGSSRRSSPPRPATRARTRCIAARAASSCPTWAAPTAPKPGGVALIDHDTFEVTGAWETERGEQHFAYDLVAPERGRRHLRVGDLRR